MRIKVKEFNIYIDEIIVIVGILSIIFKEISNYFENYFICFLFITFHELAHMFVASIFGVKTINLSIRISGLNISLSEKNRNGLRWLMIYLAGPISNVILSLIFREIPMVYSINLALAIINMFPIYPLDGHHIFGILLNYLNISQKSIIKVQKMVQIMVIVLLGIIGIYQFVILRNLSIILMVFYIILQCSNLRNNSDWRLYQEYYKNVTNFN